MALFQSPVVVVVVFVFVSVVVVVVVVDGILVDGILHPSSYHF